MVTKLVRIVVLVALAAGAGCSIDARSDDLRSCTARVAISVNPARFTNSSSRFVHARAACIANGVRSNRLPTT